MVERCGDFLWVEARTMGRGQAFGAFNIAERTEEGAMFCRAERVCARLGSFFWEVFFFPSVTFAFATHVVKLSCFSIHRLSFEKFVSRRQAR